MVGAAVYNNRSQRCQTDCYRTRSHYRKTWFFLGAGREKKNPVFPGCHCKSRCKRAMLGCHLPSKISVPGSVQRHSSVALAGKTIITTQTIKGHFSLGRGGLWVAHPESANPFDRATLTVRKESLMRRGLALCVAWMRRCGKGRCPLLPHYETQGERQSPHI
jgi:hypothetical protein